MESGEKDDVHEYTSEDMDDLDSDDFRQRDSWVDVCIGTVTIEETQRRAKVSDNNLKSDRKSTHEKPD